MDLDEDLLRATVENSLQGVLVMRVDPPEVSFANPALARMVGLTPAQIVELGLAKMMDLVHPADRPQMLARLLSRKAGDSVDERFDLRLLRPGGSLLHLEVMSQRIARPDGDRVISLFQDVSVRRAALDKSQMDEARYRLVFEGMNDAGLLADASTGIIVDANDAAARMFKRPQSELVGMHQSELHPPDVTEQFKQMFADHVDQGRAMDDAVVLCSDGCHVPVMISTASLELAGRPYLLGMFRDISQRLCDEREQQQLKDKMLQTQKLESLGVLAGGIAHDFNNLLMGVLGNAELACSDLGADSIAASHLDSVKRAAVQAADLAQQLLAYSGRGRFQVQSQNLSQLVDDMRKLLETSVAGKAVITYKLMENLSDIDADSVQLRQVLVNLVSNAAEAMEGTGGKIEISTGQMECDKTCLSETYLDDELAEGKYLFFEVKDDGCGMDEDTLRRLFDPFFTTKFTGRGLGLAAVLGIVRGHAGALRVASHPGQGTTFRVLFPAGEKRVNKQPPAIGSDLWTGSGLVLVVDDEYNAREVASAMLSRLGFEVLAVADGASALDLFASRPDEFRLALVDLTMPQMAGDQVLIALRRIRPGLKVLLSSGYNEQDVLNRLATLEPNGFLQKPYLLKEMIDKLRQVLGED